jgi:hypothetical protein
VAKKEVENDLFGSGFQGKEGEAVYIYTNSFGLHSGIGVGMQSSLFSLLLPWYSDALERATGDQLTDGSMPVRPT